MEKACAFMMRMCPGLRIQGRFRVFDNRQTADNSHGEILRDIPEQLPEEDNFIFKDGEDW